MARVRSPNYPQLSLPDALRRAEEIHKKEGQNAASREVLAKLLGYGGLNGASAATLSAISKYGLLESVGDNELRVSDLALSILYPDTDAEKTEAIARAATLPALFADIRDKWPGRPPGDENLKAYLIRRGFSQGSLENVIACYRETMSLVGETPAGYSTTPPPSADRPSTSEGQRERHDPPPPPPPPPLAPPPASGKESVLRVSLTEDRLEVTASLLDAGSVDRLIKILEANKQLLPAKPAEVQMSNPQKREGEPTPNPFED